MVQAKQDGSEHARQVPNEQMTCDDGPDGCQGAVH